MLQPVPDSNPKKPKPPKKRDLCSICGDLVTNFKEHFKKHQFTCDHCFLSFGTEKLLKEHITDIHSAESPYSCDICDAPCQTILKLSLHKHIHLKKYVCPLCGFESSTKSKTSIKLHIDRHEEKFKVRCEICKKGFMCKAKLQDHLEIHVGEPKYECEFCHKKFTVNNYLKLHIRFNHKKELFGIPEVFQCDICGREFSFEKSFTRHLSTIHKIGKDLTVECPVCHKMIANNFNLKKHMRIHTGEKNYACDKCGKRFSDMKYVRKHQSVHLRESGVLKSKRAGAKV